MAITNHERVGKALELLRAGLSPFVERELKNVYQEKLSLAVRRLLGENRAYAERPIGGWDAAALLQVIWDAWDDVFELTLGHSERTLVSELREVKTKWARQEAFSSDDAYRALDSAARLLAAVSAPQAKELEDMKIELLRVRFDEQVRGERRKSAAGGIESAAALNLKPWREVVAPHRDVASGRYQQAEFAADLWQVHLGEGTEEYRNPVEFFRRTYLTESLRRLLVGAVERLSGRGGDPVVQLQTNFGGGKTHSMLALYHLFSGVAPTELPGIDAVLSQTGASRLPAVRRVVLVGNKISPGNPVKKTDGTLVCTLWGELAYQLGGKKAFARIKEDDARATSPGDALRELFKEHGPCLVLIDEWVAYARQLHDQGDLPGGSFETQFTFAQALTEAAKHAGNCLLVVSLPASDTGGSPYFQADDVEVGGQRGREALNRLRNVIGRLESSWRPATADEGFEIVRRRLFEPFTDRGQFKDRDVVARAFVDFYRAQEGEFPPECRESDYENRIKAAYPIHPEVFERLYTDWSTLVKFQRTRGVLRLMAAVIHSLWEKGDRSPLILPASIPIDDPRVQFELTRYLSDNWVPIIESDVDGPASLPLKMDGLPNLGKFSACRRVARTIYLGSAPKAQAAHRGIEDRRIKLGCVMPGEPVAVFGDALRRLAGAATYLYQDGPRYWYSTQPTVTKLAEDRAEQLKRDPDKVAREIETRLRADLRQTGDFKRVHPLPRSGQDVPDDLDARLVVLGIEHPYGREGESAAEAAARAILENRGSSPRIFRNTLVFLAADKTRLQDLDDAARHYLAWDSILAEKESLNLDPQQVKQAEAQRSAADGAVTARIPETYQWLLIPEQEKNEASLSWQAIRLSGQGPLAARASRKLRSDDLLVASLGASVLQKYLNEVPLWRGDHVAIRVLVEDFAKYLYLPRLKEPGVLLHAIRDGLALITWEKDSFAYAESFDEAEGRYRGLRGGCRVENLDENASGLLVKPDVARRQMDAETRPLPPLSPTEPTSPEVREASAPDPTTPTPGPVPPPAPKLTRFHGSVDLDPQRVGRDAGRIAEEVIAHLVGLVGSEVRVSLEIEAEIKTGTPDHVVRVVTENCRVLKFKSQGFEAE